MNNRFLNNIILVLTFTFLLACGGDGDDLIPDNDQVNPGTPGSITCKINGDDFSAVFPFTTGTLSNATGFFTLGVGGVDFFENDSVGVVLAVTGSNFDNLEAGDVFTGTPTNLLELAVGGVVVRRGNVVEEDATSGETQIITITITKIDRSEELVSGTFSFQAEDPDSGVNFTVSDGVFSDIEYN